MWQAAICATEGGLNIWDGDISGYPQRHYVLCYQILPYLEYFLWQSTGGNDG